MAGTLFIVATPLGNLGDLSPRATEVLRTVDRVYAEDTRRTLTLLAHIDAHPPLDSLHAHNEHERLPAVLAMLERGQSVALVSDAGTPGVSDPGAELVAAAHEAGFTVCPVPGPSALATIVSVAGFFQAEPRVLFAGFLPAKGKPRRAALDEVAAFAGVVVLFEGPHRLEATLRDLAERQPARQAVVGRELTKMHEEVRRGTLEELVTWAEAGIRGEATLALGPLPRAPLPAGPDEAVVQEALGRCREAGMSRRDAVQAVSTVLGLGRRDVYQQALATWPESDA